MEKPTHYIWRKDFFTQQEYEKEKEKYENSGFRTVTFYDGTDTNLSDEIQTYIQEHAWILKY